MLPSTTSQFADATYWTEFFNERKKNGVESSFEWYGDFKDDLLFLVKEYHSERTTCLVLGCGNSSLSEDLLKYSCASKVVSVDFARNVIDEMREKTKNENRLVWTYGDVTNLPNEFASSYEVIWDKGALDALLGEVSEDDQSLSLGKRMLLEVVRCLKTDGYYFCVSLLQNHVLKMLLDFFDISAGAFKSVNITPFQPVADSSLCPFLITFCKGQPAKNRLLFNGRDVVVERLNMEKEVNNARLSYDIKRDIRLKKKIGSRGTFSIASSNPSNPRGERFKLSVFDTDKSKIPFAALILPQGREHEWNFSTEAGQQNVAESNGIGRLVFVALGRNEEFVGGMEGVQRELSPIVIEFAPKNLAKDFKIPFLAIAQDLGERKIISVKKSSTSGDISIEDVAVSENGEQYTHRRMIFLDNPLMIQSEMRLSPKGVPDPKFLAFDLHTAMTTLAFALLKDNEEKVMEMKMLVCGVGGGGLVSHLIDRFPKSHVQGIEIDPDAVAAASEWFGLDKTHIVIGDAYPFVLENGKNELNRVFIDINGNSSLADEALGLSFPPLQFLEESFLKHIRDLVLQKENGALILNFGCRSIDTKRTLLAKIVDIFRNVIAIDMKDVNGDLNVVLFASPSFPSTESRDVFVKASRETDLLEGLRIVNPDGSLSPFEISILNDAKLKKSKKKKKKKN